MIGHYILFIYSDGGPDHRLTYVSAQLALISLFRNLDLDVPIAGRTAPYHSWANQDHVHHQPGSTVCRCNEKKVGGRV